MTIRFLKPWNGYQPDAVVSGLTNEAALIAGGLASDDLDGGNDGRIYEAKFATDASGNVTGLAGPDGVRIEMPGVSVVPAMRAVLVGHSYFDQESGTYSYNRPIEYLQGTVAWANILLGRPWEVVKSHGIGGERLIDLAARIDYAIAEECDIYFWNIGINDLKNTSNTGNSRYTGLPYPVDSNQTNLSYCKAMAETLLKKLANTGRMVVILPETWPANGAGDQTKHLAARTLQYNEFLRKLALTDQRMHYVPLTRHTMDPLNASGNVKTNYYADYIHPSNIGGFYRGTALANYLRPFINTTDRLQSDIIDTYTNLKIAGTALATNGDGTLRVTLTNVSGSETLIRTGDYVSLAVPSAGNTQWNGRYLVVAHSSTYIDLDCAVSGSYSGTVNVSSATNMFDNPLFTTQTGGSVSGGLVLTSGTVPSGVTITGPGTCSVVMTNSVAHTDMDGVADGLGYWCDMTITGGANNAVSISFLSNRGPGVVASPVYGRIFAGDKVQFLCDIQVVSSVGVYKTNVGLTGSITHISDGVKSLVVYGMYRDGANTSAHHNEAFRGVVGCPEYELPLGVLEAFDGVLELVFGASGGSAQIRIGRASVKVLQDTIRDTTEAYDI